MRNASRDGMDGVIGSGEAVGGRGGGGIGIGGRGGDVDFWASFFGNEAGEEGARSGGDVCDAVRSCLSLELFLC